MVLLVLLVLVLPPPTPTLLLLLLLMLLLMLLLRFCDRSGGDDLGGLGLNSKQFCIITDKRNLKVWPPHNMDYPRTRWL